VLSVASGGGAGGQHHPGEDHYAGGDVLSEVIGQECNLVADLQTEQLVLDEAVVALKPSPVLISSPLHHVTTTIRGGGGDRPTRQRDEWS
jgi:hypothetical protein